MANAVTAEDTRSARDFLKKRGLLGRGVSPRQLAGAKADLGSQSFADVLTTLADLLDGGQGQGQASREEDLA